MRADLLMRVTPDMSARSAVLTVLLSDYEVVLNMTGKDGGIHPRSLESLKRFNSRITRMTLWRLVEEGLIEPEKNGWRIKTLKDLQGK